MPFRSLQPVGPNVARGLAVIVLALALAACSTRGSVETTGSIGAQAGASTAELRRQSDDLGRRFQANPADPHVGLAYGQTLRALGQVAQATAVLQQAALRNPKNMAVLSAYGKVLADAGRLKEASSVLANAHQPEQPDWRVLSAQGAVADQMGNFSTAQGYYRAALKIAPGEPSVMSNQGLSYALAKRLPEAERTLREAAGHPRADSRVRQNLALVLALQGRFADAEGELKRDLPAAQVAENMTALRKMVSQPNSWKAMKQAEAPPKGRQAALAGRSLPEAASPMR